MYAWNGFSGNIYLIIPPELPFNDKICILLIERIHNAHLSYNHMRSILNKLLKLFNYTFTKLQHWYYTPCMHISILSIAIFHRLKCHTSPTPNPRVGVEMYDISDYIFHCYIIQLPKQSSLTSKYLWKRWFLKFSQLQALMNVFNMHTVPNNYSPLATGRRGFMEACFKYRPEYLRLKQRNR